MVEGNRGINNDIISRLHGIMRPFLLRRLKKDVAKQLPPKFEHVVMCKLSKRQALLYEEFMSRSTTRALMSGGNYMGMMNILMQLRKVIIYLFNYFIIYLFMIHLFIFRSVIIQIFLNLDQLCHHFVLMIYYSK